MFVTNFLGSIPSQTIKMVYRKIISKKKLMKNEFCFKFLKWSLIHIN